MKNRILFLTISLFFLFNNIYSQNVGIGTLNPSEKLQVNGIVYSKVGGIKFPDNTIQETAVYANGVEDAADERFIIVMELEISGNEIKGPYNTVNFTDDFKIIDWNMNFERPGTPPTGVVIAPITIIKDIDEGSPEIMAGMFNNDNCVVVLHLLHQHQGSFVEYYRVTLTNAKISQSNNVLVHTGNNKYAHLESVSFYPSMVELEHIQSGKTFSFSF